MDSAPRFGEIAVNKGYVTPAQLSAGLRQQHEEDCRGDAHRQIGEILVDQGWLAPWEREDVVVALVDLSYSSTCTGSTPSEAIPVGRGLYGPGQLYGRRYRSATPCAPARVGARTLGAIMQRPVTASPDDRIDEALERALDASADVVVVLHHGEVVGVLDVADAREVGGRVPVARVMTEAYSFADQGVRAADAASLFRARELACLVVLVGGSVAGVVTGAELRRAGVPAASLGEVVVSYRELGVGD